MTITESLRKAVENRIKDETLYAIAKGAGVNYAALHRFVNKPDHHLRSNNIDALCDYLGLELTARYADKKSGAQRKKK